MGGFALVGGKRQSLKVDADTLRKIAEILKIGASDQVTAISIAVSSKPQPAAEAAAKARPRGRAR